MKRAFWTWLAGVAALLSVDQLSKSYFSTTLELGEAIKVTEWFNFVHALNPGAAFSLLADAVVGTLVFYRRVGARGRCSSAACLARQAAP